jgi:BMFP domain-containing protein YqiC
LLNESVEKLDLVSKQELERQKIALNLANQRLAALQQQMNALEEMVQNKNKH